VAQQAASQPYDPYPDGMTFTAEVWKQNQAHLAAQANTDDEEEGSDNDSEEEEEEEPPTIPEAIAHCYGHK
jgi:hypothetical protein